MFQRVPLLPAAQAEQPDAHGACLCVGCAGRLWAILYDANLSYCHALSFANNTRVPVANSHADCIANGNAVAFTYTDPATQPDPNQNAHADPHLCVRARAWGAAGVFR